MAASASPIEAIFEAGRKIGAIRLVTTASEGSLECAAAGLGHSSNTHLIPEELSPKNRRKGLREKKVEFHSLAARKFIQNSKDDFAAATQLLFFMQR